MSDQTQRVTLPILAEICREAMRAELEDHRESVAKTERLFSAARRSSASPPPDHQPKS